MRYRIDQYLVGNRFPDEVELDDALYNANLLTNGAKRPSDIHAWYLDDVLPDLLKQPKQPAAEELFEYVYGFRDKDVGLNEKVQKMAAERPDIKEWMEEIDSRQRKRDKRDSEIEQKREAIREKNDKPRQELIEYIRENVDAVRSGTAHTGCFYNLGRTYLLSFHDKGDKTPEERLYDLLKDDHLVEVALEGLKSCIKRTDLPSYSDVIEKGVENREYHLSYALIAGIDELAKENPAAIDELDADVLKSAVAARICVLPSESSNWYKHLLTNRPDLVAEVMIDFFRQYLVSGKDAQYESQLLARETKYREIVPLVAIPALEHFPLKSAKDQLITLANLLQAAWEHDRDKLPPLVEKKLKYKSLTVGQKVHWLAMGALAVPRKCLEQLKSFTAEKPERTDSLISAVYRWSSGNSLLNDMTEDVLQSLIQIIAREKKPLGFSETSIPGYYGEDLVNRLIHSLASKTSDTASESFRQMLQCDSLKEWHRFLSEALYEQLTRVRENRFEYPGIKGVTATLANEKPSNAADVAAVTYEAILELADRIKNGNANEFRQYWNTAKGPKGKIVQPELEEDCRNTFLSHLGPMLNNYGLSAEPEGRYVEEKRSDIKVILVGSDINIPIEIKRSRSDDLWSAIHHQLIAKYTRDPGTSGYGIYLVFWFGPTAVKLPANGIRPKTPEQLCQQLRDSLKDSRERRLIQIAVIDCTSPKLTIQATR